MHVNFTPAICQATTIALPATVPGKEDSYLVRFKAAFGSRAEYEQAQRDDVRVEMWTNLTTVGGPEGGDSWYALAFDYADSSSARASGSKSDLAGEVISFLPSDDADGDSVSEVAVFLDVRVPTHIFAYQERPRYSFTYRLIHPYGHIQWLGAFGYDGVLTFERRDPRVSFGEEGQVFATEGGYIAESERRQAIGIGKLSRDLVWEKWSFGGKGPVFSRSHITSPCGCIILTPFPAPGVHSFVPDALQPMMLTAGQVGSSLSISESGDITFHPGVETPYTPAGFTPVGAYMLALGKDSNVLDYDTTSDTMIVTSATSCDEGQTSPVALSFVPLGPQPRNASHLDVKVDSQKLANVFPGSDVVLYQKSPSPQKFKVISTSERNEDFVTIRVKPSGDQVLLAPLHDLSTFSQSSESDEKTLDVWQLAVISPHLSAQVISEVHDVSSVFPTPPPSPPLRMYTLANPLDAAPSIASVLSSIPEEDDATEAVDNTLEDSTAPVSPTEESTMSLKDRLLAPSSSERYVIPDIFEAFPSKSRNYKQPVAIQPAAPIHTLLQLGLAYFVEAMLGRVFGLMTFVFALMGINISLPIVTAQRVEDFFSGATGVAEEESGLEVKETEVETAVKPQEEIVSESMSEVTVMDSEHDDAVAPVSTSASGNTIVGFEIALGKKPTSPPSRSSHLTVGLLHESQAVTLLVRAPSSVTDVYDKVHVSIDGRYAPELVWTAIKGESLPTYMAELRSEDNLGGEVKIAIDA